MARKNAGGELTAAVPELLVFPVSGSGPPLGRAVTGIRTAGTDTDFTLLAAISRTDLVVAYGGAGGSDLGGYQLLYRVNAAGHATQYGHANPNGLPASPHAIFGQLRDFAADQAGDQLGFSTYSRGGACGGTTTAMLLNTATGAVATPAMPSGAGPGGFWVESLWFSRGGMPYVSLVPNLSDCNSAATMPAGGYWPAHAVPVVCKLADDRWVKIGTGVIEEALGPGGWLAQQTGVISNTPGADSITISHGAAAATVPGVTSFAWANTSGE